MFAFLLIMSQWNGSDQETFNAVLNEDGLQPTDRVAFACLYLPDEKLSEYINQKWHYAKSNGDISSIYLSGCSSSEAIDLLQQYVDLTGDVQTASWIVVDYMPGELASTSDGPREWVACYRNLLTYWNMFMERAAFDNACFVSKVVNPVVQQVYVSCNFCAKPISKYPNGLPEFAVPAKNESSQEAKKVQATLNMSGLNKHTPRFTTCPSCRKPTPRCAICQINMGSHSGYFAGSGYLMGDNKAGKWTKVSII